MFEPVILATFGGVTLTAYGVCLAAAMAVSLALMGFRARRMALAAETAQVFGLLAIPLGAVCARLFYCAVRAGRLFPEHDLGFVLRLWEGGFGIAGAFGGCALAAWLTARTTRQEAGRVMDCAAPACALMIALARFAEGFDGAGYGDYLENEALWFFPLAVKNVWDEHYFALFLVEGLVALGICAVLLRLEKREKPRRAGDLTLIFLLLYGATQIVLESLRRDEFLRWGFVRVNQLFGLGLIGLATAVFSRRALRAGASRGRLWAEWTVAVLCVGIGIGMEFAFEKSHLPNTIAYLIMIAAIGTMTALALSQLRRAESIAS